MDLIKDSIQTAGMLHCSYLKQKSCVFCYIWIVSTQTECAIVDMETAQVTYHTQKLRVTVFPVKP